MPLKACCCAQAPPADRLTPVYPLTPCPGLLCCLQYAVLATQIGTIQQAEAPRRTIKAVSPAIKKVKRKAALPPEARRQGAGGGGK